MASSQEQPAPSTEEHTPVSAEQETSPAAAEGDPSPAATTEATETAHPVEASESQTGDNPAAPADDTTEGQSADHNTSQDAAEAEPAAPEAAPKAEPESREQEPPSTPTEKEEPHQPSAAATTATTTASTVPQDPRAHWVPDDSAAVCSECGSEFTFVRRRHHCRVCGRLFCGDCTQQTFELPPQYGWKGPQRVCESCYLILYSRQQLGVSPVPK